MKTIKTIIATAILLAGVSMTQSCLKEQHDYFDTKPTERMQKYLGDVKAILTKPEHGWRMEYFIGNADGDYGGRNLAMVFGKDVDDTFKEKLLSNDKNYQGFNFNENQEGNENYFCKKNFLELLEEDLDIYEKYKKGEEYKDVLEEKKKIIEKEKEERKKENEKHEDIKKENIKELDDDEDDDDSPFFKIEKIKTEDNDNNFLSLLNKPPEEIKKFMENKENNNDDEKEPQENDNEIDIKEL